MINGKNKVNIWDTFVDGDKPGWREITDDQAFHLFLLMKNNGLITDSTLIKPTDEQTKNMVHF